MHFDWLKFVQTHGVHFVDRGPNTARNHISVKCPYCPDDPSEHMGLHLAPNDPKWGCLRNSGHRGRSPVFLVQALLRCSHERAQGIVESMAPELDAFDKVVADLQRPKEKPTVVEKKKRTLRWMPAMKPVETAGYGRKFLAYLRESRGFVDPDGVAQYYGLRYTLVGPFSWRLLIPFYHHNLLVGWTGRSIMENDPLRYLTLPSDEKKATEMSVPCALTDPDQYIMCQDKVMQGNKTLVICEGPMDYLKLDWYRPSDDFTVTCVFGMPKQPQMLLLGTAARKYDRVAVVLDRGAAGQALLLATQIGELSGKRVLAPAIRAKDPGEMDRVAVRELLDGLR